MTTAAMATYIHTLNTQEHYFLHRYTISQLATYTDFKIARVWRSRHQLRNAQTSLREFYKQIENSTLSQSNGGTQASNRERETIKYLPRRDRLSYFFSVQIPARLQSTLIITIHSITLFSLKRCDLMESIMPITTTTIALLVNR